MVVRAILHCYVTSLPPHWFLINNNNGIHSSISTEWLFICWSLSYKCIRYMTGRQRLGDSPTLFEKCCGFFKVPCIGLAEVGRLGQRLNILTQGRRVARTRDERPFSLTVLGSDPQPGIEPGPHWREADVLTTQPPEHPH